MTLFAAKDKGRETFTLDEGLVEIIYPLNISGESLKDLQQYLEIFFRKRSRANATNPPTI